MSEQETCGHTVTVGRFEFICIREPHGKPTAPEKRAEDNRTHGLAYSRKGDRHYLVNRWPHRRGAV